MDEYFDKYVDEEFSKNRIRAMSLLQEENSLQEIVRLVGRDALSEQDQLKLEITKSLREDYLQQNAFHDVDTYCSLRKQNKMISTILKFYDEASRALDNGVYIGEIEEMPIREKISRMKYIHEDDIDEIDKIQDEIMEEVDQYIKGGKH